MLDDSSEADCKNQTIDTKGSLGQKALKSSQREQILLSSLGGRVASMAATLIWGVSDMRREGGSTCSGVSGARGQYKRIEEIWRQLDACHMVNE